MTEFKGENKRTNPRFKGKNLRIILKDDKNFRGERLKDISLGGVFIRMDDPLPVGSEIKIILDPKLGLGEFSLPAKVIWMNRDDENKDKGMGVRFTEMPSKVEEKLKKFFKTLTKV